MLVSEILNGNTNSEIWVDSYFLNNTNPIAVKGAALSDTSLSAMVTYVGSSGISD